ncbi:phosphoribosylglycinamide formyltransferase [Atractiella rhizophila]|nr:phosphoribosylglycinamide formyltransferase [Atractiella rhizophila]
MSVTVLISGSGSNLQALLDALPKRTITHVVSSSSSAYGLTRCASHDPPVPTTVHALKPYLAKNPGKTRSDFDRELARIVLEHEPKPSLVVLAGWMLVLSPSFLSPLAEMKVPVINLHPALPGQFPGTKAIERAWKAGKEHGLKKTGVMVHYVVEEVDAGEPIVVVEVEFREEEPLEELETRMHQAEHVAIVQATRKVLEGLVQDTEKDR